MPYTRLISGMQVLKGGEDLFRRLTGELKVNRIGAEIERIIPDSHLLKRAPIIPRRKYSVAGEA